MKQDGNSRRRKGGAGPSRRQVLGWGLGAGGLMMAGAPRRAFAQATPQGLESELVFACNGGITQQMFEEQFIPDFTAKTGIKVTYVTGQPADNLARIRAQRNSPQIDVTWLAGGVTYQAIDEGLVQPIDWSKVPSHELIPAEVGGGLDGAAPVGVTVCGLLHNTEVYKQKGWADPSSWWDLWDPKVAGHVGLYSINLTAATAVLAKISQELTGDYKNLDAAFAKFAELRPNMLGFYTSAGAWDTAMQQGDLWLGSNTSVRAQQMIDAGMPVGYSLPKEGLVGYQVWAGIVKGAPHPNAAHAWVDYLLSTEVQQKIPRTIGYNPVNPKAEIPKELALYYPDLKTVFIPDWQYLSKELPNIVDRWNRELER